MHTALFCRLLCGLLFASAVQAQEYYRWQDKSGQLHVSQVPPPTGIDYEVVSMQAKATVTPVKAQPVAPTATASAVDATQIAELNQQVEQMNQQVKMHNCQQAQQNKQRLSGETVLMMTNAAGESVELTAEMRAEQREVADKQIREFCDPATMSGGS